MGGLPTYSYSYFPPPPPPYTPSSDAQQQQHAGGSAPPNPNQNPNQNQNPSGTVTLDLEDSTPPPTYLQSQLQSQSLITPDPHLLRHHPNLNLNEDRASQLRRGREYRSQKLFCGCPPKTWAKIIALVNIFFSMATLMFRFTKLLSGQTELRGDAPPSPFENRDTHLYGNSAGDPMVQILLGFISLALGYILFAGAQYGNPQLLLIWMIAAGIGLGFLLILCLTLVVAVLLGGGLLAFFTLSVVLLPISVQLFFFRMVSTHRRELIDRQHELYGETGQATSIPSSNSNPTASSNPSQGHQGHQGHQGILHHHSLNLNHQTAGNSPGGRREPESPSQEFPSLDLHTANLQLHKPVYMY